MGKRWRFSEELRQNRTGGIGTSSFRKFSEESARQVSLLFGGLNNKVAKR
jgi:hypothetical protein